MTFLLVVMAYDRYVAICHPLHYTALSWGRGCACFCWLDPYLSCVSALSHTISWLSCPSVWTTSSHISSVTLLPCSSSPAQTPLNELKVIFTAGTAVVILPLSGILVSYGLIGASILRVLFYQGALQSPLSSCGSHLSVVFLFYGTIMALTFHLIRQVQWHRHDCLTDVHSGDPHAEPFIYSLRNRDMELASGILSRSNNLFIQWESPNHVLFFFLPTDLVRHILLKSCVLTTHVSSISPIAL